MSRFRIWGTGDDLRSVYRVAVGCVVGVVFLLVINVIPVVLFMIPTFELEHWQHFWGPWLYLVRVVILTAILVAAMWVVHTLSVMAERANVYKGLIENGLLARRHEARVILPEPQFGNVGIKV